MQKAISTNSEEPKECIANDWKRKVILLFLKKKKDRDLVTAFSTIQLVITWTLFMFVNFLTIYTLTVFLLFNGLLQEISMAYVQDFPLSVSFPVMSI